MNINVISCVSPASGAVACRGGCIVGGEQADINHAFVQHVGLGMGSLGVLKGQERSDHNGARPVRC